MKKIIYILTALALTSCINDLDTLPLNKTEPISEYVYGTDEIVVQGLYYVQYCLDLIVKAFLCYIGIRVHKRRSVVAYSGSIVKACPLCHKQTFCLTGGCLQCRYRWLIS